MTRQLQLERLAGKIRTCKKCRLWKSRHLAVPGEGNPNAKIIFLGESPGKEEDMVGRPFVGPSGKFLDVLFQNNNLDRRNFFITSVIKCRPPKNRKPKADELFACKKWWQKQIEIIQPKLIVLLGSIALKAVFGKGNLLKYHGKKNKKDDFIYFPTFHPAAGKRFPNIKNLMITDFKKLRRLK